ncbi:MAG TPA: nitroreductase family protein, partial [Bdellovibrio sp.]|nr:nitroreductase family protein [Bdellovibrio sp.]
MNFFEVIENRRSIRRFKPNPVPDEVIRKALEAALKAPNSSNLQTWEFYWVKSSTKKSQLVDACLFQGTAKTASHLIVAVSRLDTWRRNRDLLIEQMREAGPLSDDLKCYYFKIIPFLYMQDPLGILSLIR